MQKSGFTFWGKMDRAIQYLKNKMDSRITFWVLLATIFIMFVLVANKAYSHTPVDGEEFRAFYHLSSFILAVFFSVLFLWVAAFSAKKIVQSEYKHLEPGFVFIALACMSWAASSSIIYCSNFYLEPEPRLNQRWTSLIFSDLNTMFFLCVIPFLTFEKKEPIWVRGKNRMRYRRTLSIIFVLLILFYAISTLYFLNYSINKPFTDWVKLGSIILTFFAFIPFFLCFYKIFEERIPILKYFFAIAGLMLLSAQFIDAKDSSLIFEQKPPKFWELVHLYSYRPFILTILILFTFISIHRSMRSSKIKELTTKSDIYSGFVNAIKGDISEDSFKKILDYFKALLLESNIFDYFFGVAILDKKNNDIIFFYFDESNLEMEQYYTSDKNGTFVGYCIDNGKKVMVSDLNDQEEISKYGVTELNNVLAPLAKSLLYLPLLKKKKAAGSTFGAFTVQSKTVGKKYTAPQLLILDNLAELLSEVAEKYWYGLSPERNFIRKVSTLKKKDGTDEFHDFEPGKRPQYSAIDEFLDWEPAITDKNFFLKEKNIYSDKHPVNRMMKGVTERNLSCGLVLFLAIAAFEHEKKARKIQAQNPFLSELEKILREWNSVKDGEDVDNSMYELFFRYEKTGGMSIKLFEEKVSSVFRLFRKIIFQEDNNAINLIDLSCDLTSRKLEFTFGVYEPKTLQDKISDNIDLIPHGLASLNGGLSKEIVITQYFRLNAGKFTHEIKIEDRKIIFQFSL